MSKRNKILVSISIIVLFIISLLVSYAFFSARISGNESTSTIVGTAAYLELTFSDGNKQINASNIVPGWSASKTFSVENTGEETAYYIIKITDITNPFVYGGINYKIDKGNTSVVAKETLPLDTIPVTSVIEIPVNTTHEYTITTYYDSIEESQKADLGKSFSYSVTIEAVYKKEINYIEDLVDLSNEVNNGNTYAHTWFLQTKDLDFNNASSYRNANDTVTYGDYNGDGTIESIKTELTTGSGFKPIGTNTNYFQGSYDGQNHRIDNIHENQSVLSGLFGHIIHNAILNLTLNGNIEVNVTNTAAGGIAGNADDTYINNCHNEVDVIKNNGKYSAGGIVGGVNNGFLYVRNSSNSGDVANGSGVGGIIGFSTTGTVLRIERSHNSGEITNSYGNYVGGLVGSVQSGSNDTRICNSYNTGDITLSRSETDDTWIGGIAGRIQGVFNMFNSYNTGNITKKIIDRANYYVMVGGLIGEIYSGTIKNCYNSGAVVVSDKDGVTAESKTGHLTTGGIIGNKNNTNTHLILIKCYNTGDISANSNIFYAYTGGLLGFSEYNTTSKTLALNSYNTGSISSSYQSGGIFGNTNSSIYPINTYNAGSVSGYNASGIVAMNQSRYLYFKNVFNIGDINGTYSSYGLYERNSGNTNSISQSYYLAGIAGSNISGYTGTSKTSAEMASTDFVNLLNQNKRAIDLSTIYDGALADYADYELSDWKYDSTKGYPVLDN